MTSDRIQRLPTWALSRAHALAQAIRLEAFAAAGSSGYQFRLLASLADEGRASQAELGRRTGIDPSDVVAAVNHLQERHLLIRARDPYDARRNVISLTPAGQEELARLDAVAADVQERFLAPLTHAERRQLHQLLDKLAEN